MSRSKIDTPVQRHRTLWMSDLHLGSPGCKAARIVKFLKQNECEKLYLVGDIFDGWKLKTKFYWTPDHTRVIKAILAKARRGTHVYYLTGNHDAFMRQFVKSKLQLGPIRVVHELVHTTADGRKLLVQHGDQYDAVVRSMPGLAYAGDFAYEVLLKASGRLSRIGRRFGLPGDFSISSFAKNRVKSLVQYLSGFDDAVYYQCKRRGYNGVICGHTHHAEVRHVRNGIMSYNCGDWVESCTGLAEDFQGHVRVLHAETEKVRAAPMRITVVRSRPAPPAPIPAPVPMQAQVVRDEVPPQVMPMPRIPARPAATNGAHPAA